MARPTDKDSPIYVVADPELKQALMRIAKTQDRTLTDQILFVLQRFIASQKAAPKASSAASKKPK